MKGTHLIFVALGLSRISEEREDVSFYIDNFRLFEAVEQGIERFSGYVDGAVLSDHMLNYAIEERDKFQGVRVAIKNELEANPIMKSAEELLNRIKSQEKSDQTKEMDAIVAAGDEMLSCLGSGLEYYRLSGKRSYSEYTSVGFAMARFSAVLRMYRESVVSIIFKKQN